MFFLNIHIDAFDGLDTVFNFPKVRKLTLSSVRTTSNNLIPPMKFNCLNELVLHNNLASWSATDGFNFLANQEVDCVTFSARIEILDMWKKSEESVKDKIKEVIITNSNMNEVYY